MAYPKVMLALDAYKCTVTYPMYASPKLDGIRCHIEHSADEGTVPLTRNNKPIPNKYIREYLSNPMFIGLDTEIICGNPTDKDVFQNTQSGVMSYDGIPDFTVYVHDFISLDKTFEERRDLLKQFKDGPARQPEYREVFKHIHILDHELVESEERMEFLAWQYRNQGYEGLILRNPKALYKQGRAGLKNKELLRVKEFSDSEAIVVGYEPRLHNMNPEKINELGLTSRSSSKEGMVQLEELGALIAEDPETGMRFGIGSGFTSEQRVTLWLQKEKLIGKIVTYKHFERGVKSAPRFPIFKGFRDIGDTDLA